MALDANNKLQNEAHDPMKVLPKRSYVDAAGFQALIDKIAVLRQSLLDNDNAKLADALKAINDLKEELTGLIETVQENLDKNAEADEAQATEQAEIKAQVEANTAAIESLQETSGDHVATETYNDFIEKDYNVFKADVTDKLDEILAAIQVVISATDVEAAHDAATADQAEEEAPAE